MKTPFYNWKIYLDTCCLSRPFNDQTQIRIRRGTEAIEEIFDAFVTGDWHWVVSEALITEVNNNRNWIQRSRIKSQMDVAHQKISIGTTEDLRGKQLETLGFKWFDALHLACTESGKVDIFLTTDDRLLRKAKRFSSDLGIQVENPYTWLQEINSSEHPKDDR